MQEGKLTSQLLETLKNPRRISSPKDLGSITDVANIELRSLRENLFTATNRHIYISLNIGKYIH